MTTSEFMKEKDAQNMAKNPVAPPITYDERYTPEDIQKITTKSSNKTIDENIEQTRASRAIAAIKKALHLVKEAQAPLTVEELNTGDEVSLNTGKQSTKEDNRGKNNDDIER